MDVVSLSGPWRMRRVGDAEWLPAAVPGCVHTDLMAAGRIADPLIGINELDTLWIDEADWEYECGFAVSDDAANRRAKWLICEGLDTIAEIEINERPVGQSFNMHRRYRFDVAAHLRPGENRIRIVFRSPVTYGRKRSETLGFERPGTEYDWGYGRKRKVYRPYVRKAQYQFGWDWGPCLATSGIWRGIRIVATDEPIFEYVTTRQHHENGAVRLTVQAYLISPGPAEGRLELFIDTTDAPRATVDARLRQGRESVTTEVTIDSPQLWWPADRGTQPLYPVTLQWRTADGTVNDQAGVRVGLRTVELVREPEADGESFLFRINGREVFCRGANWIPADPFPPRVGRSTYKRLIEAALDANMNMLRVWGGGIYESDDFYDLCDELGVLVWQDFMLACAAHPADDTFCAEMEAEARHQIRRLQNHPAIVLWCGDNENEWGVHEWWTDRRNAPTIREDYDRLIHRTLAPAVAEEDPQRPWWPSSPSNGSTRRDAAISPNDPDRGDTHFWDVWHGGKPFSHYRTSLPRFCTEFGFQSFPSRDTLTPVVGEDVQDPDHPVMRHHQRSPNDGNKVIARAVDTHFGRPRDFDAFCYLSQLAQGFALQSGVEHWRRAKPRCMGTLYWQLNDCWVVASWATVDYRLRYKAAHYFARRFFAPLLGSFEADGDQIRLWATSDIDNDLAVTARLELWHVDGRMLGEKVDRFDLSPQQSRSFATVSARELTGAQAAESELLLRLDLEAGDHRHENLHTLVPFTELKLRPAKVDADVSAGREGSRIALSTNVPALFVELQSGALDGVFSDSAVNLFPGQPIEIRFHSDPPTDPVVLADQLRIRTLQDARNDRR